MIDRFQPFKVGDAYTACVQVQVGHHHHSFVAQIFVRLKRQWSIGRLTKHFALNILHIPLVDHHFFRRRNQYVTLDSEWILLRSFDVFDAYGLGTSKVAYAASAVAVLFEFLDVQTVLVVHIAVILDDANHCRVLREVLCRVIADVAKALYHHRVVLVETFGELQMWKLIDTIKQMFDAVIDAQPSGFGTTIDTANFNRFASHDTGSIDIVASQQLISVADPRHFLCARTHIRRRDIDRRANSLERT
mmetsp:Transcript_45354/g.75269  ORF Transcript_45354/g.75269 Transcript_45354/m.75269 type:complete len:247 (+) Transcript_45354:427-1167(+)